MQASVSLRARTSSNCNFELASSGGDPTTLLRLLSVSLKRLLEMVSSSASGSGFTMDFHAMMFSSSESISLPSQGVMGGGAMTGKK